jgi:hypothetical protein
MDSDLAAHGPMCQPPIASVWPVSRKVPFHCLNSKVPSLAHKIGAFY